VILVDTSVWVDYLRDGDPSLAALLEGGHVCTHDFVIGELACGNLRKRVEVLGLLKSLPRLETATAAEALFLIEQRHLMARGIGYVDVHLLAATVMRDARLWTKDKSLKAVANEVGCGHPAEAH
jgi:predicted nucleic acid-binding protein